MPELAEKKSELVVQSAAMNKQLFDIESSILKLLAESKGNILDDTNLIETLAQAKKTCDRGVLKCRVTPSTCVHLTMTGVVTFSNLRPAQVRGGGLGLRR